MSGVVMDPVTRPPWSECMEFADAAVAAGKFDNTWLAATWYQDACMAGVSWAEWQNRNEGIPWRRWKPVGGEASPGPAAPETDPAGPEERSQPTAADAAGGSAAAASSAPAADPSLMDEMMSDAPAVDLASPEEIESLLDLVGTMVTATPEQVAAQLCRKFKVTEMSQLTSQQVAKEVARINEAKAAETTAAAG